MTSHPVTHDNMCGGAGAMICQKMKNLSLNGVGNFGERLPQPILFVVNVGCAAQISIGPKLRSDGG